MPDYHLLKNVLATLKDGFHPVTFYLKHGHKIKGIVLHFDEQSVLVERNECHFLIMFEHIGSLAYDADITVSYTSAVPVAETCD